MVDWMVEVTTSFKCTVRTYFLAVALFDEYLRAQQGVKVMENSDVHGVGVAAMYLASKYEDIYPLHSRVVSEKISHNAFSQKAILKREEEFLKLFSFQFDFVTTYDIFQTYMQLIKKKIVTKENKETEEANVAKIEELSLLLIRMAIQNATFSSQSNTNLVYTCIQAACTMLQLEKNPDESKSFFYSEFKRSFERLANEIERQEPKCSKVRDPSQKGR